MLEDLVTKLKSVKKKKWNQNTNLNKKALEAQQKIVIKEFEKTQYGI
jgi:hypothetical protein